MACLKWRFAARNRPTLLSIIRFVTDKALPKPPLPQASFSPFFPALGNSLAFFGVTGKINFD
jgi:hypothetical protein